MFKTIFVTGASGFIGSNLCHYLTNTYKNAEVYAIGRQNEHKPVCTKFLTKISWETIPDIDVCFHQAANNNTKDLDREKMIYENVVCSSELFHKLLQKNCKQFVYASSGSVYGNQPIPYDELKTIPDPLNPYAESKLLFEQFATKFAKDFNVNCIGLRYSNVYGSGENYKGLRASMIYQLLKKMLNGENLKIFTDGTQKRDWVYIKDVIEANILAAQYTKSGVFNVGSGIATSFNEIIEILNLELNKNHIPDYMECDFKDKYQNFTLPSLKLANQELNYFPKFTIQQGIHELVEEIKKTA